ncbi:MAG: translation initiation factor IF-2 [Solirubrobacteraceae bacterium]|nr:translation initiation factor IF-2 [Solirubrobacteraceae bacterium]
MAKKRVNELARTYDMPAKEVMSKLRAAGIEVKAASSAIDEDDAKRALTGQPVKKAPDKAKENGKKADAKPVRRTTLARQEAERAKAKEEKQANGRDARSGPSKAASGPGAKRPTRSSITGERAPGAPGGRRRVVIDSQASRRAPGGGPGGGGPNQGPPRRQRRGRRRRGTYDETVQPLDTAAQTALDSLKVQSGSTVKDVSEYFGVPVPDIIKKLMMLGEMATLTQTLSDETIEVLAEEFDREVEIVHAGEEVDADPTFDDAEEDLVTRPPVVTIMGHVDHGKTSLLDSIRTTEVAAGEAGGITQHIGAYQVHHGDQLVTFLDTPGHEAFTAMRARGARVTDIAVIVVAADDGVKPQTEEAIDHAKAAEVPIIVAVNKIDKEGADPQRVRSEMAQRNITPSEWQPDSGYEFVDVSAKAKLNLEDLLDTILTVAELEDLKANPNAEASGVVVESKLDPGRGPVVTLLVQRGTLKVGDALVGGSHWGRVRAMHDYLGTRVTEAVPGDPVEVLGFDSVPEAGEFVHVAENDRQARTMAEERALRLRQEQQARRSGRKRSLEDVFKEIKSGELKELNLLLKADVAGSAEAVEDEIAKLPQDEISVNVLHSGVGGINESDVMLAAASDAIIIGFNVRPVGDARNVAEREGVEIRSYSVIYKALDDLRAAMEGMLEPEEVEDSVGLVEIRQTFKASKIGTIAGSYVTEGKITRGAKARLVRDGTVVWDGKIDSLRRHSDDVREVAQGFECGIVLENFQDVKEGDMLEVYETRQVERELA